MHRLNSWSPILVAAAVAVMLALAPDARAAPLTSAVTTLRETTATAIIHVKKKYRSHKRYRRPVVRIYPRIAPSYVAYDFPYYYARGHYPTHIPPGYMYDGYPYNYGRRPYSILRVR